MSGPAAPAPLDPTLLTKIDSLIAGCPDWSCVVPKRDVVALLRMLREGRTGLYRGPYQTAPGELDEHFVLVNRRYVSDGAGDTVEGLGQEWLFGSAPRAMHNHGPKEGPGLLCRERWVGDCLLGAVQAERPEPEAKRCPMCGDWPMRCRCHATGDEASPDLWCAACGTLRVTRVICPKCEVQAERRDQTKT